MNDFFIFLGNHWALTVLFVIIILAIFIVESLTQGVSSHSIDPQTVVQLMNQKSAFIIDMRDKDIFLQGHIIGSQNMSFGEIENHIKKIQKYKDKPVVVVSADVGEMTKTRNLLLKHEFSDVKMLKGGISAWRSAELPLEKTEGAQK